MKKLISLVLILLLVYSCKKQTGTVLYKIKFTTNEVQLSGADTYLDKNLSKAKSQNADSFYNQFGDYITSLTPSKFTSRIWTIGYIDKVIVQTNNSANMLQYIEQNGEKLSADDPSRTVDFSNNNVVSFNPVIYGRVNNDNQFEDPQIDFKYFYFLPFDLYEELQLPSQYQNVHLNMFPDNSIVNNTLKVNHQEMLRKVFPNANVNGMIYFIFGNTDSTFVVNPNREIVPGASENNPIAFSNVSDLVIRSHKYSNMIYNAPSEGETIVMNGTLSFNTQDLIQVYSGADNIPYTSDDVFVYAPKFWERIYSNLDIN
jgi:hypothetical protein